MHHFLYSIQDTYITNQTSESDKNFGLDEMLAIGVSHSYSKVLNYTKTYPFLNEYVAGISLENFTGKLVGSFYGTSFDSNGSIIGNDVKFTSSFFAGTLIGSVTGSETGSFFSSSNFNGSLTAFSGTISASSITGYVTGSLRTDCFSTYNGQLTSSAGNFTGYLTGNEVKNEQNVEVVDRPFVNRSLIKFDLSFISSSIVSGDIINPKFYLKLKSSEAHELPLSYKVYAFPVSQSWEQGDGYWADGGSDNGVSWYWKDYNSGSSWYSPYNGELLTSSVDYLNDYSKVTESFSRGGGTWYNLPCTQSFGFEVSDLNIDVTTIVNSWLNNTIPNNGFILMYSGETNVSSSNANMFFFSRETNTIYAPKLDIAWDDSDWITGSFGTGSVTIVSLSPRISGSISNTVVISDKIASGSFTGNAYLVVGNGNEIDTGSVVSIIGNSETISGISIVGGILGTSSYDEDSMVRQVTASIQSGDFTGCEIFANYSSSTISGYLSGSFNENLFLSHSISGSITNNIICFPVQNSPISGSLMGNVSSGTINGGVFNGVVIDGLLVGAKVTIPFTGSYSYLTSSVSFTSSVEITGSSLSPLNIGKPFVVIIQNLKKEYSFGDIPRIGVFAREQFPLKTFEKAPQQPVYITPKYLPSSSYYSIKDNETEEIIVDFDNYTKISCDETGNYFYLDTTSLVQERYYRILVKVEENGNVYTFDSSDLFKIRR